MPKTTKKPTRSASTKTKPKKKAVPEFAKPFYKKRWFAIFALILVFSAIGGGYMIRRGDAASYVFIRRAPQITESTGNYDLEQKSNGITYKLVSLSSSGKAIGSIAIYTFLTRQEATQSSRICAHFKVFKPSINSENTITISQRTNPVNFIKRKTMNLTPTTRSGNVCLDNPSHVDSYIYVQGDRGDSTVGVDTIYGKP